MQVQNFDEQIVSKKKLNHFTESEILHLPGYQLYEIMQPMKKPNKLKIINDPVFGFINIPNDFLYDIIQHPYFQRLHRIKQLGLSSVVYPGAQHTRMQHSLGAMHLMGEAIAQLRQQGHEISPEEAEAEIGRAHV